MTSTQIALIIFASSVVGFFGIYLLFRFINWFFGIFKAVPERCAIVYTLFGKVVGTIEKPGITFLWAKFGLKALILNWIGKSKKVSLAIEQQYLRSLPVNSEEGAPLGIGLWYEMYINDPVEYLFRNSNPRGSLSANVSNSTVKCLSNMPLESLMINRHQMSRPVRQEVTEKSAEWGYKLGSCYIRKVHFRDNNMIRQIQNKVVNRLRQVTAAIMQNGSNQVQVITSAAEKEAAVDFGRAAAIRPQIVGNMLKEVSADQEVCSAFFEVLETGRIVENKIPIHILTDKLNLMLPSNLQKQPRK